MNVALVQGSEEHKISELDLWHRRIGHLNENDLITCNRMETIRGITLEYGTLNCEEYRGDNHEEILQRGRGRPRFIRTGQVGRPRLSISGTSYFKSRIERMA